MSWSISTSGKPEEVAKYLDEQSGKLTGQSKVEYDDALPHLKGLVGQSFNNDGSPSPTLQLSANGHGSESGGKQLRRQCSVSLRLVSVLLLMILGLPAVSYSQVPKAPELIETPTVDDSRPVQKAPTAVVVPAQKSAPVQAPVQKSSPVKADYKVSREFGACANGSCGPARGAARAAVQLAAGLGRHEVRKARRDARRG